MKEPSDTHATYRHTRRKQADQGSAQQKTNIVEGKDKTKSTCNHISTKSTASDSNLRAQTRRKYKYTHSPAPSPAFKSVSFCDACRMSPRQCLTCGCVWFYRACLETDKKKVATALLEADSQSSGETVFIQSWKRSRCESSYASSGKIDSCTIR